MNHEYSIEEAKKELVTGIRIYNRKDASGSYVMPEYKKNPFYLIGAPGIGKTQMVRQTAEELGIGFLAASITHHTRNSVLGLPVIKENNFGSCTEYTMPELFAKVYEQCENGFPEGILLIDEFASMSEALVAPMLAFLQSKCIGSHTLPEGWTIVLCSNPPEYNETARSFDAAVMDRVRVMNIVFSKDDFFRYADAHAFHPAVTGYLKECPEHICLCSTSGKELKLATARGWENLSDCLKGYEESENAVTARLIAQFIKSDEIADAFFYYYSVVQSGVSEKELTDILEGREQKADALAGRIRTSSYNKKWQIMQILLQRIEKRAHEPAAKLAFCDYMEEWVKNWEREEGKKAKNAVFAMPNCYENILRNRISENAFGINEEMMPQCVKERKLDTLEKNAITEILTEFEKRGNGSVNDPFAVSERDGELLIVMREWLTRFQKKTECLIKKLDCALTGVLRFCENIDDGFLMEPFLLHMNESEDLLSVLSVCQNEAYKKHMSKLLAV